MKLNSVAAVVVTRNRKDMLLECLNSVLRQSVDRVYIVDNASTDGTRDRVTNHPFFSDGRVVYLRLDENQGGAGGFFHGLNNAVMQGHDWVWLMDDDCVPYVDALAQLCKPRFEVDAGVGFICSHVVWRDGMPHRMNVPGIRLFTADTAFSRFIDKNVLIVPSCSFVSVLVSSEAVICCGLPLREMFIWGDDLEFFRRLSHGGYLGLYAWKSVVLHKTEKNSNDDLMTADLGEFFKFFFGIRNNLFIIRRNRGTFAYMLALLGNIFVVNTRLLFFRKKNKLQAIGVNTYASFASLFFYPTVEFPRIKS